MLRIVVSDGSHDSATALPFASYRPKPSICFKPTDSSRR